MWYFLRPLLGVVLTALADELREQSWGQKIVGTTTPHPLEYTSDFQVLDSSCSICSQKESLHINVIYLAGLDPSWNTRGNLSPYMGSRTAEMAELFNLWEWTTNNCVIRNAVDMRRVINWFVNSEIAVSQSEFNMLKDFTGEDRDKGAMECSRTGSPLHRLKNQKTSDGGFSCNLPKSVDLHIGHI